MCWKCDLVSIYSDVVCNLLNQKTKFKDFIILSFFKINYIQTRIHRFPSLALFMCTFDPLLNIPNICYNIAIEKHVVVVDTQFNFNDNES